MREFRLHVSALIVDAAWFSGGQLGEDELEGLAMEIFSGAEARAVLAAGKDPYLLALLEVAYAQRAKLGPPGGILDDDNTEHPLLDRLLGWVERTPDWRWRGYVEDLADDVEAREQTVWSACYRDVADAFVRCLHPRSDLQGMRAGDLNAFGLDTWIFEGDPTIHLTVTGATGELVRAADGGAPVLVRVAVRPRGTERWRLSARARVEAGYPTRVALPTEDAAEYGIVVEEDA